VPSSSSSTHPSYVFGGPLYWLLMVLIVVVTLGAVALVVDALRRPRSSFRGPGFGTRWLWVVPSGAYLLSVVALFATALLPGLGIKSAVSQWVATVTGLLMFVSVPLEIAYLLRVVFPVPGAAPEPLEHGCEMPDAPADQEAGGDGASPSGGEVE
jgi:hypothetical protein